MECLIIQARKKDVNCLCKNCIYFMRGMIIICLYLAYKIAVGASISEH